MASTRLTKADREMFVTRVMQDVPQIDYTEQIRSVVHKAHIAALPAPVRKLLDDPELQRYVYHRGHSVNLGYEYGGYISVNVPSTTNGHATLPALDAQVTGLVALHQAQWKKVGALRTSLTTAVAGFTTRDRLLKAMPEFEKYVPPEVVTTKNLPALANVVADFTKAGWPKGVKKGGAK